ncbi:MAG TPA: DUF4440 domain-containing protein [Flavisolibacter sp.]
MKKNHFLLAVLLTSIAFASCNSSNKTKDDNLKVAAASFDLKKARTFIDSLNAKFEEQLASGDSARLASHYAPDGKILLANGEPISGKDILAAWGGMIRSGVNHWKFVTTDLKGDNQFLIETGTYEIRDVKDKFVDKGNYVVTYEMQPNGEWKLYRDIGVTSMPAVSK